MARAPKIPGLRSWTKETDPETGTHYYFDLPSVGRYHIAKDAAGFVLVSRLAKEGGGKQYVAEARQRGDLVKAARRDLREWWKVWRERERADRRQSRRRHRNPLTKKETAAADRSYREAMKDAMGHQDRGETEAAARDAGYGLGMHHAAKTWGAYGKWRKDLRGGRRRNPSGLAFDDVRPGDRVTILVPAGRGRQGVEYREKTGRVVMRGPAGWVLNLGGPHGTPGVATPENFVRATRGKASERHHGFGTTGRRANPVVAAPRSVRGNPSSKGTSKWYVYEDGHHVDTEFFEAGVTKEEVLRILRQEGKYDPKTLEVRQSYRERATDPRRNPSRRSKPKRSAKRAPKRRNPTGTLCRHTLPLAKGGHGRVTVCYPQGVFPSLKAAVVNIQRELRAKFGRLKAAPVVRRAEWAYSDAGRTRGRWTFTG